MSSSETRSVGAPAARPLIVEFIGTPGSGKTTLSTEVVALLRQRGIEAATIVGAAREHAGRTLLGRAIERFAPPSVRRPLLWRLFYLIGTVYAFGFTRDHSALTRHVVRAQLGRAIRGRTLAHILFWFFQLGGRYRFLTATAMPRGALVLDDGFLHRSVHLTASHVEEPDAQWVTSYVDLLPRPDLLILTIAGRDECERRVRERGVWPHSRQLSAEQLSRYLRNAERTVHLAVRRARDRGWTVVEIATEGRETDRVMSDLTSAAELLVAVGSPDGRPGTRALT
jgi:RecA/RadA recombinase